MKEIGVISLLLLASALGAEPEVKFPEPGLYSYDRAKRIVYLRVPKDDVDRQFVPCIRVTFEEGSHVYASLGCFPSSSKKGTAPIGSSVLIDSTADGRNPKAVELIWMEELPAIPGDRLFLDAWYRHVEANGGKILRLQPG